MESNLTVNKYSPNALKKYIRSINVYRFKGNSQVRFNPNGIFEIVFQSNSNFEHRTSYSSGWEKRPTSFVGGLHNESYDVKLNGKDGYCISVEFMPNTAKLFILEGLHNFKNNLIDISEIWGVSGLELSSQLKEVKSNKKRVDLIEVFFSDRFINRPKSVIDQSLESIHSSNGFVNMTELAKSVELSDAHFRCRFNQEIGISPSQYCKILRINSSLTYLKSKSSKSLTELSYQLGYFDQSHFIKDFKSIIGTSPKNHRSSVLAG